MTDNRLLFYSIGPDVEAFTTMRDAELPYSVLCGHQVHGYKVGIVDREGMTREDFEGYDALITNLPIAIGVRTADCIPVLLYDPVHRAVGAVHAGWRGTVQRVCQKAIFKMQMLYKSEPSDIVAVIGPGISRKFFQVGAEVVGIFKDNGFPIDQIYSWDGPRQENMLGGHHIDLFEANRFLLLEAGLKEENIHVSGLCTYSDERFFSARREGEQCGRNINSIMLTE